MHEKWSNAILKCSVKVSCGFCSCGKEIDNSFLNRPNKIFLILKYNSGGGQKEWEKRGIGWTPKKRTRNWNILPTKASDTELGSSHCLLPQFCFAYTRNHIRGLSQASSVGDESISTVCSSSSPFSASSYLHLFISRLVLN